MYIYTHAILVSCFFPVKNNHFNLLLERPQLMFQTCTAHTFGLDRWLDTPVAGFTVHIDLWSVCHLQFSGSVCQNLWQYSLKPVCHRLSQRGETAKQKRQDKQQIENEWDGWDVLFENRQWSIDRRWTQSDTQRDDQETTSYWITSHTVLLFIYNVYMYTWMLDNGKESN